MLRVGHRNKYASLYARKEIPKRDVDYQALRNEVKLIQQASHRHVVKIIDYYEDSENFFIVMEPVANANLHQYLKQTTSHRTQLPPDWRAFGKRRLQLFYFIRCLATALKEIHRRGIRHRDIKPENILVQGQNIILTDFGNSFINEEATQAGFTRTLGTFKYSPPEIFGQEGTPSAGLVKRTSRSGDVFSLSCVFYKILEALSIHAAFPRVDGTYTSCISIRTYVDKVCGIKEHDILVAKRLEEHYRLLGLVQKILKLVFANMIVVPIQERKTQLLY